MRLMGLLFSIKCFTVGFYHYFFFNYFFQINVNGSVQTSNLFKDKRGDASTIMMMFCPLEELESTNSHEDQTFITSYKISISNDGQNFGEEEDIFIFNSTFQYFEEIDGELKFFLKVIFRHNLYKFNHSCTY